jgi:PKHD-type hydroxylase
MLHVPQVLNEDDLTALRDLARRAPWLDGRATAAGGERNPIKRNEQVDELSTEGREIAQRVLAALQRHGMFASAAFPARVSPPLMNRYAPGMEYRAHIDTTLMGRGGELLRTDLSGTIFLTDPREYDGGELVVESAQGRQAVKLPAGDLFLYPSTRVHYVAPVTRGVRLGAVLWVQSLVRDHEQRALLLELAQSLAGFERLAPGHPDVVRLSGCYHRLLQMWAQP